MSRRTVVTLLCSCAILANVAAQPIQETDHEVLYINYPVDPATLSAYLNPVLKPDIYEGSAWVTAMVFELSSLKLVTPLGNIPVASNSGILVKMFTHVEMPGSHKGYVILNLDFPPGLMGFTQRFGCSATQPGVNCGRCDVNRTHTANGVVDEVSTKDEANAHIEYKVTSQSEDEEFLKFILYRPWKVLQDGKQGKVRAAKQDGKDAPGYVAGSRVEVSKITNHLFEKRWPEWQSSIAYDKVRAFYSKECTFVDHSADPIADGTSGSASFV